MTGEHDKFQWRMWIGWPRGSVEHDRLVGNDHPDPSFDEQASNYLDGYLSFYDGSYWTTVLVKNSEDVPFWVPGSPPIGVPQRFIDEVREFFDGV